MGSFGLNLKIINLIIPYIFITPIKIFCGQIITDIKNFINSEISV